MKFQSVKFHWMLRLKTQSEVEIQRHWALKVVETVRKAMADCLVKTHSWDTAVNVCMAT